MNRKQRRSESREQYERRLINTTINEYKKCVLKAMRAHRIGEDRANLILDEAIDLLVKKGE